MNSHDKGVAYALNSTEGRQRIQYRANWIADVTDAIHNGFKAEPDLAPCHLPLLSDDALERVFKESEKWRDKSRERDLEQRLAVMAQAEADLYSAYVDLRKIIGALDVPHYFNPKPHERKTRHMLWTEQKARGLVSMAEDAEHNLQAAKDAESRVDLLERYVKACDDKRIPYNWNVFKQPTPLLRDIVNGHERLERLTNCDTDVDRVNWFTERKAQETEQSLRWHVKRHEAVRQLIHRMNNNGEIRVAKASELMDALLDRPQTGDQTEGWTTWEWGYAPKDITRDTLLELRLKSGDVVILDSSVVEWADVEAYRPAK